MNPRTPSSLLNAAGWLTSRQLEVTLPLAQGKTPKEIAFDFNISIKTVEHFWGVIKRKTGVENYVQWAHFALKKQWISLLLLLVSFQLHAGQGAGAKQLVTAQVVAPPTGVKLSLLPKFTVVGTNVTLYHYGWLKLAWNAETDPTVAGYNIYWGPSSGVYTNKIYVAGRTTTNCVISNLWNRINFAATAMDFQGVESQLSSNVAWGHLPATNAVQQLSQVLVGLTPTNKPAWLFATTNLFTPRNGVYLGKATNAALIAVGQQAIQQFFYATNQ